ncbi:ABC transporter G family member 2 [Rhynchospora pubera]|uniref:ABC transporter G family member 2 n=1 Tax=Rhynchospora pubera TaxID=906938 RepID=A0AAV8D152_9POAL|nr:ABC transporter G family member 2 [Rhynchospora pubera]
MMEAELADGDSIFSKPRRSLTLKFEDVVYKIKTNAHGGVQKDSTRIILHGVSGVVRPGEMLALLGPSGCGKTSLLTILGGRLTSTGTKSGKSKVTGTIAFNGCPYSSSLSRSIGFVTQDDVLYPHLTVTETLLYTALLRLPGSIPRKEKAAIAEAVMTELGLLTCRDSIIGNSETRGVSGGERKRVSIGQELLVNPSSLFLDEPTSGLDSTTAERIVSTLLNLTNGGRSVVMSIHQPSSHIFYMFHKVLLLSDGHPLYFGKGSSAMDYFASVGYEPSVLMNPCDFLLNIANGVSTDRTVHDRDEIKAALVSAYNTQLKILVQEELEEVTRELRENEPDNKKETWCTSWWNQFTVLLERGLKERRHEAFNGFKITQVIVSSLLAGLLWFQSQGHVLDQVGLVYFIVGAWVFTPITEAIFTFPQEREMLSKERSSRMYRLSSYFMARLVGDLPMELILPTIFTTIAYWMGGLKPTALSYITFLIITLITVLVSQGLGLTIGAFIMDMRKAATFASIITLCFMLAGGFFVQKVPAFIAWIKYTSIFFHAFKLMLLTQFTPADVFECSQGQTCRVSDLPQVKAVGFEHKELNLIVMLVMLVLYRVLAYLGLMRLGISG